MSYRVTQMRRGELHGQTAELQSDGSTEVMFSFASFSHHSGSLHVILKNALLFMFSVTREMQNPCSVSHQKQVFVFTSVFFF